MRHPVPVCICECKLIQQIILSQAIADLPQGGVYLGGGEVDLKLWVNVEEFVRVYKPFILDCTFPRDLYIVC